MTRDAQTPDRGSYVLFFELAQEERNRLGTFSGTYCYVGSAFGPGGLAARLGRHLRREKPIQWHIDLLTTSRHFLPMRAYVSGSQVECDLAEALARLGAPHPGFGASDCGCQSHLFKIEGDSMGEVLEALTCLGLVEVDLETLK